MSPITYRTSHFEQALPASRPGLSRRRRWSSAPRAWMWASVLAATLGSLMHTEAAERRAASPEREDVGRALATCVDGDTLVIPAGTATWTQTLRITKAITVAGQGIGKTIIRDNIDKALGESGLSSNSKEAVIAWSTPALGSCRLTGIEFQHGGRTTKYYNGAVQLLGKTTQMRVDNCFFDNLHNRALGVGVWGVIDHCRFDATVRDRQAIMFRMAGIYDGSLGDGAWANPAAFGTSQAMYVEDCVFHMGNTYGVTDGYAGAKFVVRHCTIYNTTVGAHGTDSSGRERGLRSAEVYNNTFIRTLKSERTTAIGFRGGTAVIFNNTFTGNYKRPIGLSVYRSFYRFPPWGSADGTKLWDRNDKSDGSDTPGGAGDGVFEAGTASGGSANLLVDASKAWSPDDKWVGFTLREIMPGRAASGGVRKLSVSPSPGWLPDHWKGWEITKLSDNTKSLVTSSTESTLTLHSSYFPIDFTGGGDFVLSRASRIIGNTDSSITTASQGEYTANYVYEAATRYEIRKVDFALDQPGAGPSNIPQPHGSYSINHQDLKQQSEPVYQWNNIFDGQPVVINNGTVGPIRKGRDYFDNVPKPGYVPFTYPHPLTKGEATQTRSKPGKVKNPRYGGIVETN